MTLEAGVEKGIDEDDMVAMELGASLDSLTDLQASYMGKVKEKLQARAMELKAEEEERQARLARTYLLGKEAYE